ncbi:MAG: glycosyltransferase family 2 protein, partial [Bdellovibrionales bacterium]|nr:glycosyltransferase family 2 protein [Bdellovibrionales bacterium]
MKLVSIVVPLYNEAENVTDLYQELSRVLDSAPFRGQLVFVDDGSTDGTADILNHEAAGDERVMLVRFRRNFGQTAAMAAGIDFAEGDVIVTIDGDLQNDPAEIPQMVEKLDEG